MKYLSLISILFLFSIAGNNSLNAQTQKEALSFDDIQQWRAHSVSLSDDGNWYTTLYSLLDRAAKETDSTKESPVAEELKQYYQEENQTDILYICNSAEGIKYQIPEASRPRFSSGSDWIAYQIKAKSENEKATIELKHLGSGFTKSYESDASYQFLEDKNYFITTDKNSLLIYDLANRSEHFIGNVGEYLLDKQSDYIVYTINSEDKRGNGIYLYDPANRTTHALQTGNFMYSNLSWNSNTNELAAYKYEMDGDKIDDTQMSILVLSGIASDKQKSIEYPVNEIKGISENWIPATGSAKGSDGIRWSEDGDRLLITLKVTVQKNEPEEKEETESEEKPSVQIWHGKDQKLLSERMMEEENKEEELYDAIFFRTTNTAIELSSEEIQNIIYSNGADNWAVGRDNRAYISDWDISRNDLYSINLKNGEKKLIEKAYKSQYSSGFQLSPDATKILLWDGKDYWCYDFEKDSRKNITQGLAVSFVDKEYDKYGFVPDYGFVGWVKDQNSVIVNHKLDMWLLPLDGNSKAKNLTASITEKDPLRFRFADLSFAYEDEIEDRYIDLSESNFLSVFNTKTKYGGFYKLENLKLSKLIYKPATFSRSRWISGLVQSKNSDALIYKLGDYQNYPESYLSTTDFSKPKQITNTNPQQEKYKWGERILIDYTNDDGVPLQAVLSIPAGYKKGQKLPMIV
ncbi:MAG: hypothetical protein AAGD28_29680, partial [Bacteroidota bacterium]